MSQPVAQTRASFTTGQWRILAALASSVALRMLGLSLVLPIMTLYALEFTGSSLLAGLAFGGYGLTMAALQIPLGRLSDRLGRRRILIWGMALFSLGSFLCAIPAWLPRGLEIGILILGRLVQGGGAIVSVAFATVADHVEPARRSTAMAILGIPIGGAFIIGVIAGPALAGRFGLSSPFWLTGVLGLAAVLLVARYLPTEPPRAATTVPLRAVLGSRALLDLAGAGFVMNLVMGTFFFFFPLIASRRYHLMVTSYSKLLLPMALVSAATMVAFSRGADRGRARPLAVFAFALFVPSSLLLFRPDWLGLDPGRLSLLIVAGTLFYVAFTGLEPILPSLVSRAAPEGTYGTALGLYNSLQFLGSFGGGALAGALAPLSPAYVAGLLAGAALVGCGLLMSRL
ncbi:MAG TPA: MFS transporter [Methylomirabilota bacterium]|nr:MFS transporter [Methylomirabilota bacterium]